MRDFVQPLRALLLLVMIAEVHTFSSNAAAQTFTATPSREGRSPVITITKNKSKELKTNVPFSDVTVGNPEIADVIPISDRQLNVVGKQAGQTNILLYNENKGLIGAIDVIVKPNAVNLNTNALGAPRLQVSEVDGKVLVHGGDVDAPTASRVMQAVPGAINAMRIKPNQQVMVQVRFVEVNRGAVRGLGIRWQGIVNNRAAGVVGNYTEKSQLFSNGLQGGSPTRPGGPVVPDGAIGSAVRNALGLVTSASPTATILAQLVNTGTASLDVVVSAMEQQGVLRRLAEPNLVALSGEEAMFLAGGEFPVPVVQPGGAGGVPVITVQWKEYGVRLRFVPTVLSTGIISMRIEPEVSDLDYANSVEVSGFVIPSIVSRRTRTTVELREGQAFAISGLIQTKDRRALDQVPWLGSVPVLGALFRSTEFQKEETELVVLITPNLVRPVPPGNKDPRLKTPFDSVLSGNDLDTVIGGKLEIPKTPPTYIEPSGAEQSVMGGMAPGAPVVEPPPPSAPPGQSGSFFDSIGAIFQGGHNP
jgi:pilus assembly protein CpaC